MWLGVYLLYCVLQESSGCTVEGGRGAIITGSVGDTVELPCSCKDPGPVNPQTVQWGYRKKFSGGVYTAEHSVFPKDGTLTPNYTNRVERPTQNPPGQVSLIISHLTEEDEGTYLCGNEKYTRAIILYVGACVLKPEHLNKSDFLWSSGQCSVSSRETQRGQWGLWLNHRCSETPSGTTSVPTSVSSYRVLVRDGPVMNPDWTVYEYDINVSSSCSMLDEGSRIITRSPGESVLLPCACSSSGHVKPERVTWSYSKPGSSDRTPVSNDKGSYRGRVWTFDQTGSRNLSLLISDLTEKDAGEYTCTSGDPHTAKVVLRVKGCALVENKQTVKVNRSAGESVLLSCTCPHLPGDTPVTVQWRGPNREDLLQRSGVQRFPETKTSPGNHSVLISDLTVGDAGTYSCRINQNQYRTFTLTVKDCTLSPTQEKPITRYPGQSVLLPCSCNDTDTRPRSVKWERVDPGGTEGSSKKEIYSDRVKMTNNSHPGDLSLLISNLTEQDQGTYRCSINNKQSINISLSIKDCTLSPTQEKPITRYPGQSVLLPCSCTDPNTRPGSVKWERVDSGGTEGSSKMEIYSDRVQMFNQKHPSNLSLLISNLTEQDKGTYRCSINNQQSISIRLSITDCTLSQTQENQIIRYPGQSVLLPCSCTDNQTRPGSVKWERVDSGGTEVSNKTGTYSGRVQMFNKIHPSNLSLLISNLTEQDQGTYRCSTNKQFINIRLSITDCTLSQTQENQIIRYPGQSVLLPCSCTDPNTRPLSVKWERIGSGGTEISSKMEISSDRVQMFNNSHPSNLSLLISNLTEQDQGTYRCSISDNQSISIRLSITDCTLPQTQENPITRYPGESVLLPCSCTDPKTRPLSVKWEMGGTEGSSKTAKYSGRVQTFNESHPANLSLLISNLTEQDQGTYRCSINNNQSIDIRLSIKGCTLSQTQENPITRYPGDSVLLPCSCTDPKTRPLSVKWEMGGTEGSSKTAKYSDRVQMFNESHPADLSLLISNLTEQDQGTYRCSINNNQSISIRLSITGCTLSQTQENQIIRYPGESVLLPCSCTDPNTRPGSVKWERVDSGGTEGSNKTELYSDRVQMFNKSYSANLSLLISNLTEQDQGTYRCSINNNQSINIRLSITAEQRGDQTPEQGNWVIIIIICALLLILLLLLVGAACTYRKHVQGRTQSKDKDTGHKTNQEDITYTTVTHRGSGNKPQKQDNVIYSPVAHGKKDTPAEDDVTYSTLVHGKKGKTPPAKDDVTYASVAHGKDQQANTEDEVTYSSVVHSKKGKKPKGQKKAEEDVMYSDVAFCRAAKSGDQDQVTFSKGPEEPTLYASVKPGKK